MSRQASPKLSHHLRTVGSVKILHTSDWHLGRLFHRASLLDEQSAALARIVELTQEHQVDLVVIAGDLYDRAVPPADAVELFDSTLLQLHRAGAAVVAISGNHDSAVRVGYGDRLLERLGVTVRGDLARTGDAVMVQPRRGGPPVAVYPIPYLDPLGTAHVAHQDRSGVAVDSGSGDRETRRRFTHHDAMAWAMARVRADLAGRDATTRSVVVAHAFLTGGNPSESERDLTVGQVDTVRLDAFEGIDYVALGHLHQGQEFDGGRVAYSGTPLAYSFSEQHHTKSVRLVELGEDGSVAVERIPLRVGRPLRTLTGELESMLSDPALVEAEDAWVRVVLTDRQLPLQAMARLQHRFPHAVELRHQPVAAPDAGSIDRPDSAAIRRGDPLELSLRFLEQRRGLPADSAERDLVAAAFAHVDTGAGR